MQACERFANKSSNSRIYNFFRFWIVPRGLVAAQRVDSELAKARAELHKRELHDQLEASIQAAHDRAIARRALQRFRRVVQLTKLGRRAMQEVFLFERQQTLRRYLARMRWTARRYGAIQCC